MPGERRPQYANDFQKDDLLEVLLALQGKVNRELHVATLCTVEHASNTYSFRCHALPKSQGKDAVIFNAICIKAEDRELLKDKDDVKLMKGLQVILQNGKRDGFQKIFWDGKFDEHIRMIMALSDDVREQFVFYSYYKKLNLY